MNEKRCRISSRKCQMQRILVWQSRSRHQRGQQRHCPTKLRNNAQNRTEVPQEMTKLRNNAQSRTEFPQEMGKLRNGAQRAQIDS